MFLPKDYMVLRCARLNCLLTSRAPTFRLVCKRCTFSSAASPELHHIRTEQPAHVDEQLQDNALHPPLRPKVAEYLQYVENSTVTFDDLEGICPQSHSPVGSAKYEAEYEALVAKLDRSFTVKQLRDFLHFHGIHISMRTRKRTAAMAIIEKKWGWPSLAKSQKLARSKKETSSCVFPLDPQQAFLLLGKDGTEILSLSRTHNVRLQFSRKPLSMTITGTTASVERLERHVETLKEEIVWQDFEPPLRIDLSSSLQTLSRASGCFLEGLANGKIRIWYRESSKYSASLAKKLIMQHAIEDLRVPLAASPFKHERKQISHQDPLPTYAFYPFFCEHTCASEEKSGFRLRRVGKWFGEESRLVSHVNSGDSTHDFIAIVGNHADAREQLLAQAGTFDRGQALSITATPGHVVLSSRGSSAFTLAPPLEGQKNFSEIMDWVREQSPSTEFILSAPVLFWQAPDYDQPWRRRLVYETTPAPTGRTQILICEYTPEHSKGVPAEVEGDPIKIKNTSTPVLRGGSVTRLDVLMPDDTRDLRLTLTYDNELAEASWPHELSKLVGNKTPSPMSDAPLVLEHENQQYILKEDTFFQSSISSVESEAIPVNVTSERRFDHQSSESYLTYEINCSDLFSDVAWKTFWSRCEKATQDKSAPLLDEVHYQELQ